ncbi:hypothetical protein [Tenggerimyces flavus]|uniref:Arsenate reductase n=1 Tax=Tenggerimyces flavus TaxID=1708749 RepID=A0ABV7YBF2_9ACTN|nr:hypothetical protein [Tenggerimyces flavus]MBM7787151.1 hypothetical protein [Tenggerimyces flavus]
MSTDWVPSSCTLPTVEQPLRVAEFDQLFATAVRGVERVGPTRLRLLLDAAAEDVARELTDRETSCCSFFTFKFTPAGDGQVRLEASVPAAHSAVLDALAVRASARLRS